MTSNKGAWHIWNMDDATRRQIKAGAAACGMTLPVYLAALEALRRATLAHALPDSNDFGLEVLVGLGLMPAGSPR